MLIQVLWLWTGRRLHQKMRLLGITSATLKLLQTFSGWDKILPVTVTPTNNKISQLSTSRMSAL